MLATPRVQRRHASSLIENAVGGSGAIGWSAMRRATSSRGRGGNDTLWGLDGDDTAAFLQGFASYAVVDFAWYGSRIVGVRPGRQRHAVRDRAVTFRRRDGQSSTMAMRSSITLFYDRTYLDVFRANIDAMTHYNAFGLARRARSERVSSIRHGIWRSIRMSRAPATNPLTHYALAGWREGRDPAANFDVRLYLKNNPDVAAAGHGPADPLSQCRQGGRACDLCRRSAPTFSGFDAQHYLEHNPDVAAAGSIRSSISTSSAGARDAIRTPCSTPRAISRTTPMCELRASTRCSTTNSSGWLERRDPSTAFDTLRLSRDLHRRRRRPRQSARPLSQQRTSTKDARPSAMASGD